MASIAANGQTENSPAAAQEIRGWIDHWRKAVSAKDVDRVMELYTDDVVAYDVVPPLQYVGKAAYRADYQQFFSQYDSDLRSEEHTSELQSRGHLVCRLLLEKKNKTY